VKRENCETCTLAVDGIPGHIEYIRITLEALEGKETACRNKLVHGFCPRRGNTIKRKKERPPLIGSETEKKETELVTKQTGKLLDAAVAIEEEAAKDAGALGFMARAMVQATMPHRDPKTNEFERKNGKYTLTMLAPSKTGLPYGVIPRLLLAWISTEAVRTQSKTLVLGDTLSEFMRQLGLMPTGGRWGTITRLREQAKRLFSCHITLDYSEGGRDRIKNITIVEDADLWWSPPDPAQAGLWSSTIELNQKFYEEIISHPIPVDMRALKVLKKSPLALDIYMWLGYRLSYLKDSTVIPWHLLEAQFGADYARPDNFRAAFGAALKKVLTVYPAAQALPSPQGLQLRPSPPHIAR
jgi:hypothetical protein